MANVRITLSGIDHNGFVWQNVFYLVVGEGDHHANVVLTHACDWVVLKVVPDLLDCMSFQNSLFDVSAKYVKPDSSYTIHKAQAEVGNREGNADSGALAGVIQWLPADGPQTGRQYITGLVENDYQNDIISDAYKALLTTLIGAFQTLNGNDGLFDWLFVLYSKGDSETPATTENIIDGVVIGKVGVLSKRIRA